MFGRKKSEPELPKPREEPTPVVELKAKPAKMPEAPKPQTIMEFCESELIKNYGDNPDLEFAIYAELRMIREYMAFLIDKSNKTD